MTWNPTEHNCFAIISEMSVIFYDALHKDWLEFRSIQLKAGHEVRENNKFSTFNIMDACQSMHDGIHLSSKNTAAIR